MSITLYPQKKFGGVDSRSNPLGEPQDRAIRCLNFVPKQAGFLELRYGYSVTNQVSPASNRIVNFTSYKKLDGTKLLVFMDGIVPKYMNLTTGVVTSATVRGTAFASAAKGSFVFVNNRLQFFNGTDKKWFDGTTWRDIGIRVPSPAEAAAVSVTIGAADPAGVPASTVGGTQPGFVFYMAYYNPTTGDIGNQARISGRLIPTVASDFGLTGLPDLSSIDTEWVKLIGRTNDSGIIAYNLCDAAINWFTVANAATTGTINVPLVDGNSEMPQRNAQPLAFDKASLVGDYVFANLPNSATIYRSGSALSKRQGLFPGNAENCFAANDIETFPTNAAISCIVEYAYDTWCFSLADLAILSSDQTGAQGWQGPWPKGCAGQRAFAKTPYGAFWITGDKQLATMSPSGPVAVSEEYDAALLAKIGDAFLPLVEMKYLIDPSKNIEHLDINCLDANGNPFHVIHDFKLRDDQSTSGQAYERSYAGLLSTTHTIEQIRDASDRMRIWAGASDGNLYELNKGANDAGTEYAADYIQMYDTGTGRPSVPYVAWYGDQSVVISIGRKLKTTLTAGTDFQFEVLPPGVMPSRGEDDFFFKANLATTEVRNPFMRFQLNSHSVDGNLDLNSPPHIPLENYGRIYATLPAVGKLRGNG